MCVTALRRLWLRTVTICALSVTCSLLACAAPRAAPIARVCEVSSIDGVLHQPLAGAPSTLALLFFLEPRCPIANALAPEMTRIADDARVHGVTVYFVYPGRFADAAEIRSHNADFALSAIALLDRDGALLGAVGATISPEAAIVRRESNGGFSLLYRGRINDLFEAPGQRRPAALHHDLAQALRVTLAGGTPQPSRTTAIGCVLTATNSISPETNSIQRPR